MLELLSEEIPARMQDRAREDLARGLAEALTAAGLACEQPVRSYATPRRLVLWRKGYKVGVARRGKRSFEVVQPHYKAGEPNGCPSSFRLRRYTWNRHRFKVGKAKRLMTVPPRVYQP